jgi:hypothetical protein
MAHGRWWPQVVQQVVHLLIVGESQEGKSTSARALLQARATTDTILVLDPHGKFNDWGVPVIGVGRDWAALDRAFVALGDELSRRYRPGEPVDAPLTIFIDEYPAIAANCPSAKQAFLTLAREGAKARMRLVILTQDANVETLGISGQGAVRRNFTRLLLSSFAVQALPESRGQAWPAVLEHRGSLRVVDRSHLPKLALQRARRARVWEVPETTAPTYTAGTRLADEPQALPATDGDGPDHDALTERRAQTIRTAAAKGLTRTEIATLLGGNHNRAMRLVKAVLETHNVHDG